MISSICEAVKHDCDYFRKGVLSWIYFKLPCILARKGVGEGGALSKVGGTSGFVPPPHFWAEQMF